MGFTAIKFGWGVFGQDEDQDVRLARPEEIAATVAFLASEEAGYITGANISVNGGMHMM